MATSCISARKRPPYKIISGIPVVPAVAFNGFEQVKVKAAHPQASWRTLVERQAPNIPPAQAKEVLALTPRAIRCKYVYIYIHIILMSTAN